MNIAAHGDSLVGERVGRTLGCARPPSECSRCTTVTGSCELARRAFRQNVSQCARTQLECRIDERVQTVTANVCSQLIEVGGEVVALMLFDTTSQPKAIHARQSAAGFHGMIGTHPVMEEMYGTIRRVARLKVPVLIQGESGTGKEMVAVAVHEESGRAGRLVTVNSGALPEGVLESELFGHVRGAFTGAVRDKRGRFEIANGGTLFLDEIGEISPIMQVKLLRALQEGTFERVGGEETVKVDVRVICATNRNLENDVATGRFRADLFYRISVVPITVPPLRMRASDIPKLAKQFVERAAAEAECAVPDLSAELVDALIRYSWPGNVRELDSAMRFALLNADNGLLLPSHLPPRIRGHERVQTAHGRLDARAVNAALRATQGNKRRAADILGVSRATLYRFLGEDDDTIVGS